jgi:hypothetical protein
MAVASGGEPRTQSDHHWGVMNRSSKIALCYDRIDKYVGAKDVAYPRLRINKHGNMACRKTIGHIIRPIHEHSLNVLHDSPSGIHGFGETHGAPNRRRPGDFRHGHSESTSVESEGHPGGEITGPLYENDWPGLHWPSSSL